MRYAGEAVSFCRKKAERAVVLTVLPSEIGRLWQGIYIKAIADVSSIDVKQDEAGLLDFCSGWKLLVRFYSADELQVVKGDFSASEFVKSTVGVDNVCERAAMLSAGKDAKLIVKKTCMDGVTVAVAQEEWSVRFE